MEQLILYAAGLSAVGYVGKLVWDASHGKTECNCGDTCNPSCDKACKYPIEQDHYPLNVIK